MNPNKHSLSDDGEKVKVEIFITPDRFQRLKSISRMSGKSISELIEQVISCDAELLRKIITPEYLRYLSESSAQNIAQAFDALYAASKHIWHCDEDIIQNAIGDILPEEEMENIYLNQRIKKLEAIDNNQWATCISTSFNYEDKTHEEDHEVITSYRPEEKN